MAESQLPESGPAAIEHDSSRSVINRAMILLEAFTPSRREMTLSGLARAAGLPKTTTLRLASILVEIGCLQRDGNNYSIGLRMQTVGNGSVESLLRLVARPWLHQLHRATGNTLHLAVLRGTEVFYVEKLTAPNSMPTPTAIATRLPAYLTGVGKALLAYEPMEVRKELLDSKLVRRTSRSLADPHQLAQTMMTIRRSGVAHDDSEIVEGLACIAVPIWYRDRPLAALSLAFPASLSSARHAEEAIRITARHVSQDMSQALR